MPVERNWIKLYLAILEGLIDLGYYCVGLALDGSGRYRKANWIGVAKVV